jgi:hypothetical protein
MIPSGARRQSGWPLRLLHASTPGLRASTRRRLFLALPERVQTFAWRQLDRAIARSRR